MKYSHHLGAAPTPLHHMGLYYELIFSSSAVQYISLRQLDTLYYLLLSAHSVSHVTVCIYTLLFTLCIYCCEILSSLLHRILHSNITHLYTHSYLYM